MKAIYTNPNGGKSEVEILGMLTITKNFNGGGNPFNVTSTKITVSFKDSGEDTFTGYLRNGVFCIFGSCSDSGFTRFIEPLAA